MFWRYNLLTSHIDTLLDKEDVTLQELLDEDDVLQECKAQNRKLIDFLVRPENIEELVHLVTQEPSEDTDEKTRYKYPNTACELLTSDVTQITDKLVNEDALLNKVYSFLEAEGPLNPLLASFFSKVMGLLITRKSEEMVDFLKSKEDFIGQLLHHLGTSAIMDLLLRLITCIESPECRTACINWLNEQCLVQKLVKMIDPAESDEKHCNASQSLCDMIRLSREQMSQLQDKAEDDPLLQAIESQETVTQLLNHMFNWEKNESVIINGLTVIQTLLEFRKLGPEGGGDPATQMTALDAERLAQGVSSTLLALTPRLKDIHSLLLEPPKQHYLPMATTVGSLNPPLGNTRLQVARLVSSLLVTNTHSLNIELANIGTISVLLDLYVAFSWNNFLHTQVEQCINTVLSNGYADGEEKIESPLLSQLFEESKIIQRILDAWEDNEQQQNRPGGHRRGFMGHLYKMANHILHNIEKGNNSDRIKEFIQDIPEERQEKWQEFVSGALAEHNKQNTVDTVGSHPLHTSSEDDDPDFRDIPFPQDTAMQQLQQMTSNFIDQFGFNEDEFAEQEERVEAPFTEKISSINFDITTPEDNPNEAALFEQACNDRMHQFEEVESDEELWEEKEITFSHAASTQETPVQTPDYNGRPIKGGSNSDDSENSTDSEEELDSPQRIHQTTNASDNTTTSERMDVDAEWSNNSEDSTADVVPIAMDTGSVPWESSNVIATSSVETNEDQWRPFPTAVSHNESKTQDENWADFSKFSPIDSESNTTSSHPSPEQNSSPVAMDTADSSSCSRTAAYLVDNTSVDPVSEASHAHKCEDLIAASGSTLKTAVEDPQNYPENQTKCNDSTISKTSSFSNSMGSKVVDNLSSQPTLCTQTSELQKHDQTSCTSLPQDLGRDADEEDLSANFNFLATSGLMRSHKHDADIRTDPSTNTKVEGKHAHVEDVRAQAKEAMDMYAISAASSHNGPV